MGIVDASSSLTLSAVVRAAKLPPETVIKRLYDDHAITNVQDLRDVLSHADAAKSLPALWRVRLEGACKKLLAAGSGRDEPPSIAAVQWCPNQGGVPPRIVVMQGDLTTCKADAIVNPANSQLSHGGGLACAIARRGGTIITDESQVWIRRHKSLSVGKAMVTSSGALPCRYVVHTVGPCIEGKGPRAPTSEQAQQLRDAVWSVLCAADKLGLATIAIPGISSGTFGYPRDLAACEIVSECTRFCRARSAAARRDLNKASTTIKTIVLMNNDTLTCESFLAALKQAAKESLQSLDEDPFETERGARPRELQKTPPSTQPHKASGVLVTRVGENDFEVLVGVEFRVLDNIPGRYVNFLGGRVDHASAGEDETPLSTACREFSEEVGGLLTVNRMQRVMEQSSRSVYLGFAKYTLFLTQLDTKRTRSLPALYAKAKKKTSLFRRALDAEHDHLVWVPWRELVAAATTSASARLTKQQRTLDHRGLVHTAYGPFPVSDLVQRTIASFGGRIEQQLEQLMLKDIFANEKERVRSLKAAADGELILTLLESDWKLRLRSPPLPPRAPIEVLTPQDAVYRQIISELDAETAARVVSVRSVRVSARDGVYQQYKQQAQAIPNASVTENEPFYHGTPERWRATAIAMNGFDLRIQLCGRSMGNGVYTSTQIGTAQAYSAQGGSLLRLRGLVVAAPNNSAENTIVRNHVYVFPSPKALLPLAIVDYAAIDESDTIGQQQKGVQDEYKRLAVKRRALEKVMLKKEMEFERGIGSRLRAALNVYSGRLAMCEDLMRQNNALPPDDSTGTLISNMSFMSQKLFLERRHFATCLPIYEVKPRLVKLLQSTPVVIVIAETGSGKSTQLPQILLDDVLPMAETRRIAILQPRRVNAVSLCQRVSEERGCLPGREVGYTIGRGESNATPSVTRLEFMTHGLFVQLARDYDQLVNKYCAVIVDEAHERSVDVDLSLALLQRALRRRSHDHAKSFRVIVTSATIEKHAQHFQRYLDPSMHQSAIFRISGRTFPVYVEHRGDVQVQRDAVGTAGVGKVLTSTAIQTALDLLRTTETGNILIFLPGEGSISDALALARNDIAMSATVEALDVFSSDSLAFCFRMGERTSADEEHKETDRARVITTCVVGFHGKITRAERDHVLHPRFNDWRLVVFTTNIAETGVTIPNVRYVIDTGLERRVRWNAALDLNEMVTERISLSSMTQRTGRAGRTASGICVRLFPEESTSDSTLPDVTPGVQNAMIYKAVLLNKQLEQQGEASLELLDPIDPILLAQAQERLVSLGALDPTDGKLTNEGSALLRIGVDLRLGRFLIACAHFGCLATGVKLASVLVASDASERLLPDRKKPVLAARWDDLVDTSGDHITLLNIIEAYEQAEQNGQGIQWCQDKGFELDVFADADASKEYLLKVLDALRFPLADDAETMEKVGGRHTSIRLALCAAYYDQLARPRMDATAKNGFVRVLDESTSNAMRQNAADFAVRTQGRRPGSSEDEESDTSCDDGSAGEADVRSQSTSDVDEEPTVKLASRSTLWRDDVASSLAAAGNGLVVFGSLMLTDGAARGEPSVQLVSCVTAEEVQRGAPEWCRLINFERLIAASARETLEFNLAPGMNQSILMDRGSWLTQLTTLFHSAVVATIRKGKLLVTCPKRSLARVQHHVQKQLRTMEPETVVLQLPTAVNMGKIIGKGGQQVKTLEAGLQDFLSSEHRGAGHHHIQKQRVLSVNSDTNTIQITLQGASKPLMGVVVGRVQSAIVELHGNEMLPLVLDANGECGQQMQQCPRLAQLLNRVPPSSWATRDDVMLQLAHVLVWTCGASIYGGFLRDWVVRGEAANDIDVQLSPPQISAQSIEQTLTRFLADSNHANAKCLHITESANKGAAYTLTIKGNGIAPIDVDLVDPARVQKVVAPPGVDCDAGNLLLNQSDGLRKKIPAAGASLSAALENTRHKRFVFFYPLTNGVHQEMSVKRLRKYLGRGWTCLSPVPRAVQKAFLTPDERRLICPEPLSN